MDLSQHLLPLLETYGRLTPGIPANVASDSNKPALGEEAIGWLTPLDD